MAHCDHGGDGDLECGLTLAQVTKLTDRGGRGGGGEAMGKLDWEAVLHARWRRVEMATAVLLRARAGEKASEVEK